MTCETHKAERNEFAQQQRAILAAGDRAAGTSEDRQEGRSEEGPARPPLCTWCGRPGGEEDGAIAWYGGAVKWPFHPRCHDEADAEYGPEPLAAIDGAGR